MSSQLYQRLGSAPDGGLLSSVPCAYFSHDMRAPSSCKEIGKQICGACLLVKYCSKDCQKAHWPVHKLSCKSPLISDSWLPDWSPGTLNTDYLDPEKAVDYMNFSWGGRAAFDSLKLGVNEGEDWDKDLDLCFVDSGDLRSMILLVNNLPRNFRGKCNITISDFNSQACVLNLLLLLIFSSYSPEQAAEIAIHVWYSATLPHGIAESLKTVLLPRINDKMKNLPTKPSGEVKTSDFIGTFKLGIFAEMKAIFPGPVWAAMSYTISGSVNLKEAMQARREKVLRKDRSGFRERVLYGLSPYYRVAKNQFTHDGLVLPFGACRKHFTEPNVTLLPFDKPGWLPSDYADPLHGWNFESILKMGKKSSAPRNDIYGALYFYLRKEFIVFSKRLRIMNLQFTLFGCKQYNDFAKMLFKSNYKFDRIDLVGVTDQTAKNLGMALGVFGPLLKPVWENPHATIITIVSGYQYHLKNSMGIMIDIFREFNYTEAIPRMIFPDPEPLREKERHDPYKIRITEIQAFMFRWELLLQEWEKENHLCELAKGFNLEKKAENKIMEMWPYVIDESENISEMVVKVMRNTCMNTNGNECYMEWHCPRSVPAPGVDFEDTFEALLAVNLGIL